VSDIAAVLPTERKAIALKPVAQRAPATRSRQTNDPRWLPKQTPSRRAQDRRRKDLVALLIEACGGPAAVSGLGLVAIRKAAELTVAAEVVRVRTILRTEVTGIEVIIGGG
jgi:hypothetical protein